MTDTSSGSTTRAWLLRTAAILIAGAAAVVLVAGIAAWAVVVELEVPEPPELAGPSVVLAADGSELARFTAQVDRRVVELEDVSQVARDAVVAAEDAGFREHTGVDALATLRAVWVNVRTGSIRQGGSTLTQQYVKNTYTGDEVTLRRKVEEALLSVSVERQLSKDEILERYLNTVYFGEGASGIEAAAQTYFDIPAAELDAAQAATLAQLLPAPSDRNPVADPEGTRARRDALLERMGELEMLSPAEVADARAQDVAVVERSADPGRFPYVVQHVRRLLVQAYGEEEVLTGALRVTTTIRPDAMAALHEAVAERLPLQEDRPAVDAGALAADPATGEVLAWYGGRDHGVSQFDLAMQAQRRPGSTFKPIAYLAALEHGIGPDAVYDAPSSFDEGELCDPGWGPGNAGGSGFGAIPLREGLVNSVNTVFAQVGCDVGSTELRDTAFRLGIRTDLLETPQLAIGGFGSNTTVADLTQVFSTFANDGVQCPLHTIRSVLDRDGDELDPPVETTPQGERRAAPEEVLDARPSDWAEDDDGRCARMAGTADVRRITDALQDVVAETTGRRADIDRPQAGKTGTTDDEVDAWFAGYTPGLAMVVRVGDETERPLTDIAGFDRVQGGTIPALVWHDAARALLEDVEEREFPDAHGADSADEDGADVQPADEQEADDEQGDESGEDADGSASEGDAGDEGSDPEGADQADQSPPPDDTETEDEGNQDDDGAEDPPDDSGSEGEGGGGGGSGGGGGGSGGGGEEECGLLELGCDPGG